MRFSTTSVLALSATLALLSSTLVSAALTPAEVAEFQLKEGSEAKLCPPCLQKAMHNHFPHACARDLDPNEANYRPTGATDNEERCVCLAFNDLFWMKADCSSECPHVFNEAGMKYFLPASEIEGCDRWLDFATGEEKVVEGFPLKDKEHKPEVFEIVAPPPQEVSQDEDEEDDGRVKVTINFGKDKLPEKKEEKKEEVEEAKAAEPEAEAIKKDEL
ncbi:hypothetical protein CPC16_001173 [Podila verticillata]|nr:hypothetical protein CPC16_001173 [Podila verticillata]